MPLKPTFFPTPPDFRAWLKANHDKLKELIVGFHKKGSRKPSITWPESVQVALCFGWIDGVRKSLNETSYTIRFTPRRPTSTWSSINIKFVQQLTKKGLMHPAGLKAFAARDEKKSAIYSYEQRNSARFTCEQAKQFRSNKVLGILPFPSPLVSKGDNFLGHQRQKGRDKAQAAFRAHRSFAESADSAATDSHEEEVASSCRIASVKLQRRAPCLQTICSRPNLPNTRSPIFSATKSPCGMAYTIPWL